MVVNIFDLHLKEFEIETKVFGKVFAKGKVDLKFVIDEKITLINVINGQKVFKNQVIAVQNNDSYYNKVITAKEQVDRAKIDVEDILLGFNYSLKDSINIPAEILKMAKNRSNYNTALAALEDTKINLLSTKLKSPFDGVVANLNTSVHDYPDNTKPFCTILDNSIMNVDFQVLEEKYNFLSINQPIEVGYGATKKTKMGKIIQINPVVDSNGMISVIGTLNNESLDLLDGMNVYVTIKKSISNTLSIPKHCIVLRDGKRVVFTYENGKAVWNYVETSYENSDFIVIEKGLKEGDKVISSGNLNLAHDTEVLIED